MKTFFTQKNKGFTLIEVMVAISIFTVSVLTLLLILSQSITNINYAKENITAGYLAQEGIEYIRNMRDTYVLYSDTSEDGWNDFNNKLVSASCENANGCYFNDADLWSGAPMPMTTIAVTACGASCPSLLYDSSDGSPTEGRYNYTSGNNSGFVRKIQITQINSDETKVFSTVFWLQGSNVSSVNLSEDLFNWTE